ncbi:hypothetical protein NDU88_007690 [Pleurodeles waltl]|uniref:Uncharacterized protein n=1 Tax=Pleurodeles waltl TaxID=8319 RepID=A0AAV7PQZ1_PLEWA|nr:hypothetical protein NDU88_007690 [Pleurodeles waltl]
MQSCAAELAYSRQTGACQGISLPDTCWENSGDPSQRGRRLIQRRCRSRAGVLTLEAGGVHGASPDVTSGVGLGLQGRGWRWRPTAAPEATQGGSRRFRGPGNGWLVVQAPT